MDFEGLRARIDRALVANLRPPEPLDPLFLQIADTLYEPESSPRPKRLRPILAIAGARLAGADDQEAWDVALALEMIHDYSVVLDDFMDDDTLRRGRPAAWVEFGASPAITAACGLYTLAFRQCADWVGRAAAGEVAIRRARALDRLLATAIELHDAQLADLAAEDSLNLSPDEALVMARGRSSLVGAAPAIGADAAGGDRALVEALARLGPALACAYSLIDDARSFAAVDTASGKQPGGDIRQRKKTYPIVLALRQLDGEARAQVGAAWRSGRPLDDDEVRRIAAILAGTDAAAQSVALAGDLLAEVKTGLRSLPGRPDPQLLADICTLLDSHFKLPPGARP